MIINIFKEKVLNTPCGCLKYYEYVNLKTNKSWEQKVKKSSLLTHRLRKCEKTGIHRVQNKAVHLGEQWLGSHADLRATAVVDQPCCPEVCNFINCVVHGLRCTEQVKMDTMDILNVSGYSFELATTFWSKMTQLIQCYFLKCHISNKIKGMSYSF
jgi:hypothetical protein